MKHYGPQDEDTTALDELIRLCSQEASEVLYVTHFPRILASNYTCRRVGSVTVIAKLRDGTVIKVRQDSPGGLARRFT